MVFPDYTRANAATWLEELAEAASPQLAVVAQEAGPALPLGSCVSLISPLASIFGVLGSCFPAVWSHS